MKKRNYCISIDDLLSGLLDEYSELTGIPKSRIVEDGIILYFKKNSEEFYNKLVEKLRSRIEKLKKDQF